MEQEVEISSPVVDGALIESGYFGGAGVEKSFVALNIYAGFELAAAAAQAGDYGRGLVALEALRDNVQDWLRDAEPSPIPTSRPTSTTCKRLIDPARPAERPRAADDAAESLAAGLRKRSDAQAGLTLVVLALALARLLFCRRARSPRGP